jgi:phosphoribosylanthranilate isomerase
MLIQIYEVSTTEEARSLCRIGIDHIGVLVGHGEFPREQTLETAATIARVVRPPSKLSALFLTADISLIEKWARKLQPAILHLGAAPEQLAPNDVAVLRGRCPECC